VHHCVSGDRHARNPYVDWFYNKNKTQESSIKADFGEIRRFSKIS
jgi:hypothetical protein